MLDANKVLKYFVEYEKKTALMENSLHKVDGELFNDEQLRDPFRLEKISTNKKVSDIFRKVSGYKDIKNQLAQGKYTQDDLISQINRLVSGELKVAEFLSWLSFSYPDNSIHTEEFIKSILEDTIVICYPLLKKKTKEETTIKPLITFLCRFEERELKVERFFINRESLEVVVASLTNGPTFEIAELEKQNLLELLSANEYTQQNDLFEIINILNGELSARYGRGLQNLKSHEGWLKLNQAFVTFEALEEISRPIFQKEIQRIIDLTAEKNNLPELLKHYLVGNRNAAEYSDSTAGKLFHCGSYTNQYPINKKQWHILEAVQRHELLSVNGPPGTGKSTLLKEMFADNMVKKALSLIKIWEQPWERFKERSSEVYRFPGSGDARVYSMVLTSTNNKAVDNIGLELLKEVSYFSEFVNNEDGSDQATGFFCARLGNAGNKEAFTGHFVPMFLNGLELEKYHGTGSEIKAQFLESHEELERIHESIEQFIQVKMEIDRFYSAHGIERSNAAENKTKYMRDRDEINNALDELARSKNALNEAQNEAVEKVKALEQQIVDAERQFQTLDGKIKGGYRILENYRLWQKGKWYGWIFPKRRAFFKEYTSEAYIENRLIKKVEEEEQNLQSLHSSCKQELDIQIFNISEAQEQLNKLEERQLDLNGSIKFLNRIVGLLESQLSMEQELFNKWGFQNVSLKDRFDFSNDPVLLEKRYRLFQLSLRISEQYIVEHAEEVKHNLKLICDDGWFKPFYNEGNKRDAQFAKGIRTLWDTLFLCFPVVTSTLHSFGERTFQLLPEMIDTLFVDEAGQIMPHYLSSPLFRSKRAVIVGDIEQLEPVRLLKSNVIEQFSFIPEKDHDVICVQRNSAQSYADRNSQLYEWDYQKQRKGMILTEHRRCEESIMLFSNRHVYGNILSIINKDNHNKLFGRNMVAIDVRGLKDRRSHSNISEVHVCKKLVDLYVREYGEAAKKQIGIITPFSKQRDVLQETIQGVDIGTVHTFQGQEKKFIIFSSVIDSEDFKKQGLAAFVGGKTNLLNVALSRAKEQFVLVGNLDVISSLSQNNLHRVLKIIIENGAAISPFDEQFHTVSSNFEALAYTLYTVPSLQQEDRKDIFSAYIRRQLPNHLILSPEEHYHLLIEALHHATQSIVIFSPWIMDYVVNDDFIELIRRLRERKVDLRIGFGYKGGPGIDIHHIKEIVQKDYAFGNKLEIELAISKLREIMGQALHYIPPIHSKILLVDDRYLFIGSHNWLSKIGRVSKRDEVSCLIMEERTIQYLKERYIQIKLK